MITFLKGNIIEISPTHVVVDCNGVGYFLNISLNTFSKFEHNQLKDQMFYTYLSIKEDSHTLYGFFDKEERECFILLLSVSGVGASTARMILSSLNPVELQNVIISGDVNSLKSVKGIGLKSAQRIIIDLKDKMNFESSFKSDVLSSNQSVLKQEAIYALEKLGFPIKKTNSIIDQILCENPDCSVEDLIKAALKNL
jgi:Holliday junction DNA helicase RuvA